MGSEIPRETEFPSTSKHEHGHNGPSDEPVVCGRLRVKIAVQEVLTEVDAPNHVKGAWS